MTKSVPNSEICKFLAYAGKENRQMYLSDLIELYNKGFGTDIKLNPIIDGELEEGMSKGLPHKDIFKKVKEAVNEVI